MRNTPPALPWFTRFAVVASVLAVAGIHQAQAAGDGTWSLNGSGNWVQSANWASGIIPGATNSTTNTDTATFSVALSSASTVNVDANRNIKNITFSATSGSRYKLDTGSLLLSDGGTILSSAASGARIDTINTAVTLLGNASFTNNSTNSTADLSFTGTVAGSATTGNTSILTLNGSNTDSGNALTTTLISDGTNGGKLAIVKSGAGQWRINGTASNTYSGGFTMGAGTLGVAGSNTAFGTGTLTINGGIIAQLNATGGNYANAISVGGDFSLNAGSLAPMTFSGNMDLGGVTRTISQIGATGTATLSGTISNGGLTKASTGNLTLSGSNSYAGATTVSAGVLNIRNGSALGSTAAGTSVTSGAALELQGGIAIGAEAVSLAGSGISSAGALRNISGTNSLAGNITLTSATRINSDAGLLTLTGTIAVDTSNRNLTFGGAGNTAITGAGTIGNLGTGTVTKDGTGTLTIGGTSSPVALSYTGLTTVSAGTLIINGTVGSGGVTVASGATLGGNITAGGTTTIQSGGVLAVGNSPGTGTFSALNLSGSTSTGTTEIQFNAGALSANKGTDFDTINVTGNNALTYGGTLKLVFFGAVADNQTFDIFNLLGTPGGAFAAVSLFDSTTLKGTLTLTSGTWSGDVNLGYGGGLQTFTFSQATGDLNVVPEPASVALIALGLAVVLYRVRGRSRTANRG